MSVVVSRAAAADIERLYQFLADKDAGVARRRWGAPEWWRDPGAAELLASQVLDAVMRMAKQAA